MSHPICELNQAAKQAGLEYLIVGGHAVVFYGVARFTRDLDLLVVRESVGEWKRFLERRGYKVFFESKAFVQFDPPDETQQPVDLVIVDTSTWEKMSAAAYEREIADGVSVRVPDPKHLIAMKLRAAQSETRRGDATDWNDVIALIDAQGYRIDDPDFRALVLRFGGESAVERLERRGNL